ncbi:hypothetical protein DFJ67_5182 [Asanoa ferruginea]|uniref:Uncharacterized protein n=1 Tax=Asanoa ferruginea TaxID=53367 RepID=A0A3D9ZPG7_9ACTN|nr:hypothetical protein [Asanoa ferruginea]REF99155.1 hypothetical protein DFJ67_5182 [Asanoa ferruginea]GIF51400.1 hypothetical protein Afe04nite_59390 [Asanoa ferruginea]
MKAVVYRAARRLGVEEIDGRRPGPAEVRIAVAYTAIRLVASGAERLITQVDADGGGSPCSATAW